MIVFGVYALNVTKEAEPGCRSITAIYRCVRPAPFASHLLCCGEHHVVSARRNGLRLIFNLGDSWRRPQHELGERSRLLASEETHEPLGSDRADAADGSECECDARPFERRTGVDNRRRAQQSYMESP